MDGHAAYRIAVKQFSDARWRLNNLYKIIDQHGNQVDFVMNTAQERLFDGMHYLNVILKARQLGFTTLIQMIMLDACMFNSDVRAGTIAHTREDAEAFFRDKVRYPYDHMPERLRAANPATEDSARRLTFANNSSLRVGTSLRSGTFQYLHVSEFGKLCAKYPDKAREVVTGAFNTVHPGQCIFVESTAEGQEGAFYEMVQSARALQQSGHELGPLDFRFFFYPWWQHPGYEIDPKNVVVTAELDTYFGRLEKAEGCELGADQRAWYAKKSEQQGADMKREFPSTPEEAFEAAIEGAYFAVQLAQARTDGRVARVPYDPEFPVNTFWDLGRNDSTAIWFHQRIGRENRFIDFYENSGEWLGHYVKVLKDRPYVYGDHYAPHDIAVADIGAPLSRLETAAGLGLVFITVPAPKEKAAAIEPMRRAFASSAFDEAKCAGGIKALAAYRKEWDDKLGVYKDKPRHDWASHPADAYQTFALGYVEPDEHEDDWDDGQEDGRSAVSGY